MIIGVTGSLATGSSTVARYMSDLLKAHLICADEIAHLILGKKEGVSRKIVSAFGKDILNSKGVIDRRKLGKGVFCKKKALDDLCSILHPVIIGEIRKKISAAYNRSESASIIVDAALLIESGFHKECDIVIVVISSLATQLERACSYKKMCYKDALSRIRLQMPLAKKVCFADYIIDNSHTRRELKAMCKELVKNITT